MINAVIFDMDGVLIDSELEYLKLRHQFALTKNPHVKIEDLYPMVGHVSKEAWLTMERVIGNGESWQELRAQYLSGANQDTYKNLDYVSTFRKASIPVLKAIQKKGLRLAIASSNSLWLIEHILKLNGIFGYFEKIISGDQFQKSKPHPEIYLTTAEILGVRPEDCLAVEDSTAGITAAHRAGMTVLALTDKRFLFDQSLADYRLNSLTEVLEYL